jgi:hypothetical protein
LLSPRAASRSSLGSKFERWQSTGVAAKSIPGLSPVQDFHDSELFSRPRLIQSGKGED